MYCLHSLVWAEAEERDLDQAAAEELVRRCEVVICAVHNSHEHHRVQLGAAHGEEKLHRFFVDGRLDVAGGARPGGLSKNGFANVYQALCVRIGALSQGRPPRRGKRSDLVALRDGLGELVELAQRDVLDADTLRAAGHLCLCQAADQPDGEWLRRILIVEAEAGRTDDRYRQLTCLLLLDTLHEAPSRVPLRSFHERWAFGDPLGDAKTDERARVACMWRAAALRNYSIGAWRSLWRWLAEQLNHTPMTIEELGRRLAEALDDVSVAELISSLPARMDGSAILPAEAQIAGEVSTPMSSIRLLALGAARLNDLEGETLSAFVGSDPHDLGPRWVAELFESSRNRMIDGVAHELVGILVRRAKRVAQSKMYLTRSGRPYVPTRLRDRDGVLSVRGQEGDGEVALRIDTLVDVLAGLGVLDVDHAGICQPSELGEELRARLS